MRLHLRVKPRSRSLTQLPALSNTNAALLTAENLPTSFNIQLRPLRERNQPPLSLTMPHAHNSKVWIKANAPARDEHLIFVKNVPAYLATEAIPKLFAPYRPDRIKNVYPKSDTTTFVVGFETHEKASQAQQETDGMRLENVVLRVEMYSKHRSVRYLQEERTKSQSPGATEDGYEDDYKEEYEEERLAEAEYVLPFARKPQDGAAPSTWAHVAGTDRQTGMMPLPPPPDLARLAEFPALSEQKAQSSTPVKIAVPRIKVARDTENATSTLVSTEGVLSNASFPKVDSYEGDAEQNQTTKKHTPAAKLNKAVHDTIFAPWEPINTSQRISQRHCRACTFCQLRMRR
jgi:hypothetical protein